MRLLIVGGGPAGLATARGYREAGGRGPVTLLAAEAHAPYDRPPLTKDFLRGEVGRASLPIEAPAWFAGHDVDLVHARATELDLDARRVTTADGRSHRYDACVLATGSEPVRPPVPGAEDPGVLVIRTIEDAERLAAAAPEGTRVVVVGSGFIGCEAAVSLALRGARVTMLAEDDHPQEDRLGPEAGARIAGWLAEAGVDLRAGAAVERIDRVPGGGFGVGTDGGSEVEAEVVLLAAGVVPRGELATAAGLDLTATGRVPADERLATIADGLSVAGDLAAARNAIAGRALDVEHWGEALNQGEVAGRSLAGDPGATWATAPGFWSEIGPRTIKHVAWGDGHDEVRFRAHADGAFTVHYGRDGVCVGVLAHGRDEDYERGRALVESGAPLP